MCFFTVGLSALIFYGITTMSYTLNARVFEQIRIGMTERELYRLLKGKSHSISQQASSLQIFHLNRFRNCGCSLPNSTKLYM